MLDNLAQNRVLATIVFTDAVAFSARMEADEPRTVANIRRDLDYIASECAAHDGRVIKNTGDGLLMHFGSAGRAIECAMKVQSHFASAAETLPPQDCLQHRIGIHLGDVVVSESDVLGDGVNVAARILAQAEPGGICFSQTVYEVVKNRLAIKATFLGPRELKNIRESVPLYQILVAAAAQHTLASAAAPPAGGLGNVDIAALAAASAGVRQPASPKKGARVLVGVGVVATLGAAVAIGLANLNAGQPNTAIPATGNPTTAAITAPAAAINVRPEPTAAEQLTALVAGLKQRNPGFSGQVQPTFDDDAIVGLAFSTEMVKDITPVARLKRLRTLKLTGPSSTFSDLSPLQGMQLSELSIEGNSTLSDLTPLKGMPLTRLRADVTAISDLSPLAGMRLVELTLWNWRGSDLSPLRGMPLTRMNVGGNGLAIDLSPLQGAPLQFLCINITKISDISPLIGAPLKTFFCENTLVSDLSPLRNSPVEELVVWRSRVTDISTIQALPLTWLNIDFQPPRDAAILRQIKTLRRINDQPAEEFWKNVVE
ncbi:adenylate/guanylate cyclase domain-containing protein [Humisphaera borealis]|uniref:Guanylate cyclase domain-containing protein n=1 Tax=Humisphaera borealis TaxID=2807512 RepID=A0A7M2X2K9_9BACT|nr:adenylate/guanylate cyclase domain-containing protein [Humisphaera borealis]QOV91914.1 hypothetical protein IPV69_11390 [Humisphaera borealis]